MLSKVEQPELNQRVSAAFAAGRDRTRFAFSGKNARFLALGSRLTEVLLAILLCVFLAIILLRIFAPLPLPKNAKIGAPSAQTVASPLSIKNPFPMSVASPVVEVSPDVADTTLDLRLTGVWAVGEVGSATIETPGGKQSRYAVGDDIIDGVSLVEVYTDRVIISRNGVHEALRFETKLALPTSPAATQPDWTATPLPTEPAGSIGGMIGDFVRLAPGTDEDGNLVIEIYAARNRATFNAYGFQDGDRLVSVNGTPAPTNPAALTAMLSSMQRLGNAAIIVRRKGEEIPVNMMLETFEKR